MIEIDNVIVSLELIEEYFCCDLNACKGICCIEGESGAPLERNELPQIASCYETIRPYLPKQHIQQIETKGFSYEDKDGDLVTGLIGTADCVFSCKEKDGSCRCSFEKSFSENKQKEFYKPISCHLYPIRLTQYRSFIAANMHHWDVCKPAKILGKNLNIRCYQFLKDALTRRFGVAWFNELDNIAQEYLSKK